MAYSLFTFRKGTSVVIAREEDHMLTGQYQRSLDSKSRVTLPVIMRKQFGETVMLVPWKDALHGFTTEAFETWENNLGINPRNREDNDALLYINSMTTTVEIDSAGRVALGKIDETARGHRERLGLDGDLMVVGAGDHFEIWNAERWNAKFKPEDAAERFESLFFVD